MEQEKKTTKKYNNFHKLIFNHKIEEKILRNHYNDMLFL